MHPLALGDVFRARQQIERLARTLLLLHRTKSKALESIVKTLTKGLGSHDYIISRSEARQMLGRQVVQEDLQLEDLVWQLYKDFAAEMELGVPFDPKMALTAAHVSGATVPLQVVQRLVIVESRAGSSVLERELRLSSQQLPLPMGAGALPGGILGDPRADLVRLEWKKYMNP